MFRKLGGMTGLKVAEAEFHTCHVSDHISTTVKKIRKDLPDETRDLPEKRASLD